MDARQSLTRTNAWAVARVLVAGFVAASLLAASTSAGAATPTMAAKVSATPTSNPTSSPTSSPTPSAGASAYDLNSAASLTVVVNKVRPLKPVRYRPQVMGSYNLAKPASDALTKMRAAMAKAGAGDLILASGYRSYFSQKAIYERNLAKLGVSGAQKLTAMPGYSEHQTGLAADLAATGQGCRIFMCFADTPAGKWLAANSWQFGFILRYPSGATKVTGYQYEPWHFRFVGKPLAAAMHKAKASVLETFLGLPAAPSYLTN